MERDSIFKDHHFRELQRRESIHGSLSLTTGILTLVIGGLASLAKSMAPSGALSNQYMLVLFGVTAGAVVLTIIWIARCLIGYQYAEFADPKKVWEKSEEWKARYPEDEGQARAGFNADVERLYAEAASRNGKNNRHKSNCVAWAHRSLLFALVGMMLLGSIQLYGELAKAKEISLPTIVDSGAVMIQKSPPSNPTPPPEQPSSPTQERPDPSPLEMVYSQDHKLPNPPADHR